MLLDIQTRRVEPDVTVVELKGKLTLGRESQRVETLVGDLLKKGETKLVLDLTALDFTDSTGVGIMAFCSGELKEAGGEMRIAGATGRVEHVLKMARLDTLVGCYATADEACTGFAST